MRVSLNVIVLENSCSFDPSACTTLHLNSRRRFVLPLGIAFCLECRCERAIWTRAPHTPSGCSLKFPTRYEPLRTQLEKYGLATSSNFQLLSSNPTFLGDAVPIFDIVEHKDTAEVAMLLADRLQRLAKKQ